jgi:hypothetical protein
MNRELESKTPLFIPSQPDEHYVGIDAATFSKNQAFWRMWSRWPFWNWKSGLHLNAELWDLTEEIIKDCTFPKFKYNLFLQYKRPDYISGSRKGNEYVYWRQPYLRYEIDPPQQHILFKLEQKTSAQALVIYACASFWKWINPGKFVENSNVVQPHRLQGHSKYTFIQSGKDGCAFSEPFHVEGIDLLQSLRKMQDNQVHFENNVQFLQSLERDIKVVVKELDESLRRRFEMIQENSSFPNHRLGMSFVTILNFNLFANTTWGIGYQVNNTPHNEALNGRMKGFIDGL